MILSQLSILPIGVFIFSFSFKSSFFTLLDLYLVKHFGRCSVRQRVAVVRLNRNIEYVTFFFVNRNMGICTFGIRPRLRERFLSPYQCCQVKMCESSDNYCKMFVFVRIVENVCNYL